MKKIIVLLLLVFITPGFAQSDEDLEKQLAEDEKKIDQNFGAATEDNPMKLNGYFLYRLSGTALKGEESENRSIIEDDTRLQLTIQHSIAEQAALFASVDFYYNHLGKEKRGDVFALDEESQKAYEELYHQNKYGFDGEIREAYVDVFGSFFDIRIGNQIIKWGAADSPSAQLNPNSIVSPPRLDASFLQQTEDLLLSVSALKLSIFFGKIVTLEGVCVPVFKPSKFPDQQGFWRIESSETVEFNGTQFIISGQTLENEYPEEVLKNIDGGGRLGVEVFGTDINFYYMYKREAIPQFRQEITLAIGPVSTAAIKGEAIYERSHRGGASIRGEIKALELGFRGDVNYIKNRVLLSTEYEQIAVTTYEQKIVEKNQVAYNVGMDYELPIIGTDFSIDYFEKRILKGNEENEEVTGYETQGFLIPRLGDDFFRKKFFMRVYGIWDIREKIVYVKPEIEIRPSDNLQLIIGGLIFANREKEVKSTLDLNLGAFPDNDMVYARVRYNF